MSLAYKRFKVYLRIGLVLTVVLLGAIVLFMNRNHRVQLWFFGLTDPDKPVNVVWVMLWTVAITRTVWWLFSLGRGLMRDWREVRRQDAIDEVKRARQEIEARAKALDEKLEQVDGMRKQSGEQARPDDAGEGEAT